MQTKKTIKEWADEVKYLNNEKPKVLSRAKDPVEAMKFNLMNANLIFKFENAVAMLQYSIYKKFNVSLSDKISIFKSQKAADVFYEKKIKPKCKLTDKP